MALKHTTKQKKPPRKNKSSQERSKSGLRNTPMKKRTTNLSALVIKRYDLGETDRIVTLLSQPKGRIACVAKGVRRLNSSTRASLEPGNLIKAHLIFTKGMPLLVQTKLLEDVAALRKNLAKIRQLTQILEIFDKLFVEEEIENNLFEHILKTRQHLICGQTQLIRSDLNHLIKKLGFADQTNSKTQTVLECVQQIVERPMRSFEYLRVKES